MGKKTGIKWCDHTFNPWWGCTKVSTGCKNCYAEGFATRRMGLPIWGQNADRRFFGEDHWKEPLRWNKAAKKAGVPAKVFCASMADVFEDRPDLVEPRLKLFVLIRETPWLRWLLLTKRPENMTRLAPPWWSGGWPENVWAGTTVENGEARTKRLEHLVRVPAVVRFLSVEPQVEGFEIGLLGTAPATWGPGYRPVGSLIQWVIQGGESGSKARPFDLEWAWDIKKECAQAGVAYFFKQAGARPVTGGIPVEMSDSHGGDEGEFPQWLRGLRAFPDAP